mgnify:CR=1 FL=1
MKILALDSSGLVASVAVVSDDNLIGEYTINYKKTHSQTLLPMLDEVAKMTELDLKTIDFIAVSAGPGSFPGLCKAVFFYLRHRVCILRLHGSYYHILKSLSFSCLSRSACDNLRYSGLWSAAFSALPCS